MHTFKKIPGILLLFLIFGGQVLGASSSRFQVHSGALVASDTVDGKSSSYQVQARSKFEQVYGTSSNFQIYSSFSGNTQDFVLGTLTLVDGNIASRVAGFLIDNSSTYTVRDTKNAFFAEISEFSDDIPFFSALVGTDTIAVTEKPLRFVQAHILEPIVFLPVDRISESSQKIFVGLSKGNIMNTTPGEVGTAESIDTLPEIENFSEKHALRIPTKTNITLSQKIDICMEGTPTSLGIESPNEVDVFYSQNETEWFEDITTTNKQYIGSTGQFCFQTNHLASFVIGQKQVVIIPPEIFSPSSGGGGGSSGSGKVDNHSYGWNPQSIIAGMPTKNKAFRMARKAIQRKISGKNSFFLWDSAPSNLVSSWKRITSQEEPEKRNKENISQENFAPEEPFFTSAPKQIEKQKQTTLTISQKNSGSLAFFEKQIESNRFTIALNRTKLFDTDANFSVGNEFFEAAPRQYTPEEQAKMHSTKIKFFCLYLFLIGILVGMGVEYVVMEVFNKDDHKKRVQKFKEIIKKTKT